MPKKEREREGVREGKKEGTKGRRDREEEREREGAQKKEWKTGRESVSGGLSERHMASE